ncbi:MAG: class I SAM-dependent methyltransferase [Deltaproteobacteria bacterium]|nr:class I SAM-dependent methyltransferase [Deltaproteobacteria bacterium]
MSEVELLSEVRRQSFPEEWYDASEESHFWFRWRMRTLSLALADAKVGTNRPLRALDVGCGSGVLAAQLEAATAWSVDATDLNLPALERCRPRRGRTFYYDVTERRAELSGAYDVVILFDLLEHLSDPRAMAKAALAHLKPGGTLLVNVPALPSLTSEYDRAAGHLRRYTRRSLERELDGLGLRTLALRYWGLSLVPLLAARKIVLARPGPCTIDRGFRPPLSAINAALCALMRLETWGLRQPPLGTSVLYAGLKGP